MKSNERQASLASVRTNSKNEKKKRGQAKYDKKRRRLSIDEKRIDELFYVDGPEEVRRWNRH